MNRPAEMPPRTWVVEARIPDSEEPWRRFALAFTRDRARALVRIPRRRGYHARVRAVDGIPPSSAEHGGITSPLA